MHTDTQPTQGPFPPATTPAERHQIARFHAAMFPTRLALSRWQHGGHIPHLHYGAPALRAAWYATARRDFQAWLDRGGFSQYEEPSEPEEPQSVQPTLPSPLGHPGQAPQLFRLVDCRPALGGLTQQAGACTDTMGGTGTGC